MNTKRLLLVPIILCTVLILTGCSTSNVGQAKSQEFERTPGGIEAIPVELKDPFGQNLMIYAVREDDGNGGDKTSYFPFGGNGFFTTIGPATAGAIGFWAGMEALDPDMTNVSATGGNASSDQSQSQRGSNRGRQGQKQGQNGSNSGESGTSGYKNLDPPSSQEKP